MHLYYIPDFVKMLSLQTWREKEMCGWSSTFSVKFSCMIAFRVVCSFRSYQPIGIHTNRTVITENEGLENAVVAKLVLYANIWINKVWMVHSVLAESTQEGNW